MTLSDRLLVTTEDGERTERTLGSDAEVLAGYRDLFGIALDRVPTPGSAGCPVTDPGGTEVPDGGIFAG